MKYKLFFIAMIFCSINNAYGVEDDGLGRVVLHSENLETGSAASIGIYGGDIIYGGFNFSYITSTTILQRNNRSTIYPVYFTLGLRGPWKISPYIEAGVDVADFIIDEIFDDENDSIDETDYYFSGGLEFSVTDRVYLSAFVKEYSFIYKDNFVPKVKNRQRSYGGGIIILF